MSDIKVALNDLKKKKNIMEVTANAAMIKSPISSTIFCALMVLMYGIPEILASMFVYFSKASVLGNKSLIIKSFLADVFTISFFKKIAERTVCVLVFNKMLS